MSPDRPFTEADDELLVSLLEVPTVNPLEGSGACRMWEAQERYARAAREVGLEVIHHAPADPEILRRPEVPESVRAAAANAPEAFLADQPNLVLRLGESQPAERTLMFNVHLDTVAGEVPVTFDGQRFTGRGAIDAKGLAVALLAGLRQAVAEEPDLPEDLSVLIQAVPGEEAGCMGVFGTRPLVEAGFVGALNVFCEPTRHTFADRSSATMTARVVVDGEGSHDDSPGAGHNATVILAQVATTFSRLLLPAVHEAGGRACIAGGHTGDMHNRVYGRGSLLVNLAYESPEARERMELATHEAFEAALLTVEEELSSLPWLGRTARDARQVTRLEWVKRGLPALAPRDPGTQTLLTDLGLRPYDGVFTCDAIWMHDQPGYTVIYGPGDLVENHAHAEGEFVDRQDLETYAQGVSDLTRAFRRRVRG